MEFKYKTLEKNLREDLNKATSLIIVHASKEWDLNKSSKRPIQSLINNSKLIDYIYEFTANHNSFIKHKGVQIDNNLRPGDYYLGPIAGKDYVIAGGKLGECHYLAFATLLCLRTTQETRFHLPSFAIYDQLIRDDREVYSEVVSLKNPKFNLYERIFKDLFFKSSSSIFLDFKKKSGKSIKGSQLRFWSSKEKMLDFLRETNK